jgi:glycosyltransferase involved in cell wall biosynthesis
MRIAYVGDFINHGKSLQTFGTSIVILLSLLENVDSIDVFCPEENENTESFEVPQKVKLFEFYKYNNSISLFRLLKVQWHDYDVVIFNMLPTGYGNRTVPNALALITPIILKVMFKQNKIKVIYHNSIFTNDIQTLGYNSTFDRIRSLFLGIVERALYKKVVTFVLLAFYQQKIDARLAKNKVQVLNSRYLEAITTLYVNKELNNEWIISKNKKVPIILMHGSWGPQKNIELGLNVAKKLKAEGLKFKLIISGSVNLHFPQYKIKFQEILNSYSYVFDSYLGTVSERDIMKIFLDTSCLIMPYNAPGGHSGVLEQAIFFEVPTAAMDFREYMEQAEGISFVKLIDSEDGFKLAIRELLLCSNIKNIEINIRDKIKQTLENIQKLIE